MIIFTELLKVQHRNSSDSVTVFIPTPLNDCDVEPDLTSSIMAALITAPGAQWEPTPFFLLGFQLIKQ